ncbi:hypothetical protein R1sor_026729 [Riccia sorocarpa]|uniref:NPF family transporter n=1 Tax=Riccia sorocarpa TaxID=122646 RepID=A0ABD3GFW4_9MARC
MSIQESLLGADQRLGENEDIEKDIEVESNHEFITHDGTVDYKGRPASKTRTGGWRIATYICAMEVTEKIASTGAQVNLVTYLTLEKKLQLPYAANMVTNFMGTSFLFSLLGGVLADSFLGRFHTLIGAAITEMLGFLIMMMTTMLPFLNNQDQDCRDPLNCRAVHGDGLVAIYIGLYFIALGVGGIKATSAPFGADQFEAGDPAEASLLPSFFNWFYWAMTVGAILSGSILVYVQDRVGWDWGYGILLVLMAVALCQLLLRLRNYRYRVPKRSPLFTVATVLVAAVRNYNLPPLAGTEVSEYYDEMQSRGEQRIPLHTTSMRWLDKAAKSNGVLVEKMSPWKRAPISDVEDVKMLLRLLPVWLFTIFYWTVLAQATTFAVAQIETSDRHLGPNFEVPAGSVGSTVFNFTILLFLPLYERLFVPFARKLTGNSKGITVLQRIGIGMASPVLAMMVAAMVESKRLRLVEQTYDQNVPNSVLPFSVWWFVPQYVIMAIGEAFVYPGQLDFFYSEAPDSMQSLGTALLYCTISVGFFSSSAIVSLVNAITKSGIDQGWLQKDVNTSRLDKYYWLLCILAFFNFIVYLLVSSFHHYKQVRRSIDIVYAAQGASSESSKLLSQVCSEVTHKSPRTQS